MVRALITIVQEISLPITTRTTCNDFIKNFIILPPHRYITLPDSHPHLCVGNGEADGGCYGDAGGPVIVQKQGETR